MVYFTSLFLATALSVAPINNPDNDIVVIEIPSPSPEHGSSIMPHSPSESLASGFFEVETGLLVLDSIQNVGTCNITITSTAGDYVSREIDTCIGFASLTLSGAPGVYVITITLSNDVVTGAQFIIF